MKIVGRWLQIFIQFLLAKRKDTISVHEDTTTWQLQEVELKDQGPVVPRIITFRDLFNAQKTLVKTIFSKISVFMNYLFSLRFLTTARSLTALSKTANHEWVLTALDLLSLEEIGIPYSHLRPFSKKLARFDNRLIQTLEPKLVQKLGRNQKISGVDVFALLLHAQYNQRDFLRLEEKLRVSELGRKLDDTLVTSLDQLYRDHFSVESRIMQFYQLMPFVQTRSFATLPIAPQLKKPAADNTSAGNRTDPGETIFSAFPAIQSSGKNKERLFSAVPIGEVIKEFGEQFPDEFIEISPTTPRYPQYMLGGTSAATFRFSSTEEQLRRQLEIPMRILVEQLPLLEQRKRHLSAYRGMPIPLLPLRLRTGNPRVFSYRQPSEPVNYLLFDSSGSVSSILPGKRNVKLIDVFAALSLSFVSRFAHTRVFSFNVNFRELRHPDEIRSITPQGGTALAPVLRYIKTQIDAHHRDRINIVILTDGRISDPDETTQVISSFDKVNTHLVLILSEGTRRPPWLPAHAPLIALDSFRPLKGAERT